MSPSADSVDLQLESSRADLEEMVLRKMEAKEAGPRKERTEGKVLENKAQRMPVTQRCQLLQPVATRLSSGQWGSHGTLCGSGGTLRFLLSPLPGSILCLSSFCTTPREGRKMGPAVQVRLLHSLPYESSLCNLSSELRAPFYTRPSPERSVSLR